VEPAALAWLAAPEGPRGALRQPWSFAPVRTAEELAAGEVTVLILPPMSGTAFRESACEATLGAWGEAQRHALVRLQPYLDHVDASLLHFYRREVAERAGQGGWRVDRGAADGLASACVRAWTDVVTSEEACAGDESKACRVAPRVHLVEDLRVGVPRISAWRDPSCAEALGFDPRAELLDVARAAAEAAGEATSTAWAEQAQRTALLGELAGIVEDACEPAPRVEDGAARVRLERRLRAIGSAYAAAPSYVEGTRWQLDDDAYAIATGDVMEQVSRIFVAPESPADHMAALLASLREDVAAATACGRGEWGAEFFVVLLEGDDVTWVSTHPVTTDCPAAR
jgi:hypothetical protein